MSQVSVAIYAVDSGDTSGTARDQSCHKSAWRYAVTQETLQAQHVISHVTSQRGDICSRLRRHFRHSTAATAVAHVCVPVARGRVIQVCEDVVVRQHQCTPVLAVGALVPAVGAAARAQA